MKKLLITILILFSLPLVVNAAVTFPVNGGTGSTTLTGILIGNQTSPVQTLTIGSNLTLTGTTLSATGGSGGLATTSPWTPLNLAQVVDNGHVTSIATSSLNLTTSAFKSANISQWTNDSGYLTSETDPLSLHLTDWYATSSAPQLTTLANLATVGTISTGVWHGTPIADTYISSSGNWNTAYTDRITGANYPLSITSNVLSVVATSSENCTVTCFLSHNVSQWTNDAGYLTANQTITLSGDVSGSGSTAITTAIGANKVTLGDIAQVAAHSLLVNNTGSTGNVVAVATSSLGLTTASFASANVSQWTNDAGYVTSSGVTSVSGTTNQITSSGGTTPTLSLPNLVIFPANMEAFASSTIGNATQTGGLTISGGATTTGNAYIAGTLGIASTSPSVALGINGSLWATSQSSPSILGITNVVVQPISFSQQNILQVGTTTTYSVATVAAAFIDDYEGPATSNQIRGLNAAADIGPNATGNSTISAGGGMAAGRYVSDNASKGYNVSMSSGVSALAENLGTLASTTNAVDLQAEAPSINSGDLISNFTGVWVRGGAVSGTLTTEYGLQIDSLTAGGTNYGIYQAGSSDINYFNGKTGFGTTTPQHSISSQTDIQDYGGATDFGTGGNTAIVCYLADGTLGHISITSLLASGSCLSN